MAEDQTKTPTNFEHLSREELEALASDISESLDGERHIRGDLEQRVREVTQLNKAFQEHIRQEFGVIEAYQEVLEGLDGMVRHLEDIIQRARSQPLPDLLDITDVEGDNSREP